MKKLAFLICVLASHYIYAAPSSPGWSAEATTGAAMGYCLAKHPYQSLNTGTFTKDGYEVVAPPGVVGAVRRNFVYDRSTPTVDQGVKNTCARACGEFGKLYGPTYKGYALRQKVVGGVITSGIGDMASLAMPDEDYYTGQKVTAGIWSRGNTWHESDVAQADYCCCQAK